MVDVLSQQKPQPNTVVTTPSVANFGDAAAIGSAADYARGDHVHGMPWPFWNRLINGDMAIVQAYGSVGSAPSGTIVPDMWRWVQIGSGVVSLAQQPGGGPAYNGTTARVDTPDSLQVTVTTADTSIAAGDLYLIDQEPEGRMIRGMIGGSMALSWWARAHRTGIYCVALRSADLAKAYILEYTIAAADTWQYFTAVFPTDAAATGGYSLGGKGFYLSFTLSAGSNFQSTAGSWITGNKFCTANQVNGVGATTDAFRLALVNMVPGTVPIPLLPYDPSLELIRAKRYRQVYTAAGASPFYGLGQAFSTTQTYILLHRDVPILGTPTIALSATSDFALYDMQTQSGAGAPSSIALSDSGITTQLVLVTMGTAVLTVGHVYALYAITANTLLIFEAYP